MSFSSRAHSSSSRPQKSHYYESGNDWRDRSPSRRPYSRRGEEQSEEYLEERKKLRQKIFEEGAEVLAKSPERQDKMSDDEKTASKNDKLEKKKSLKESKKKKSKKKKRKHSESQSGDDSDNSSDDRKSKKNKKDKKKKHKKNKSRKKSSHKKKSRKSENESEDEEELWEEKPQAKVTKSSGSSSSSDDSSDDDAKFKKPRAPTSKDDGGEVGMVIGPLPEMLGSSDKPINFGHALLPGEGAAMAAFVQDGKRIPRRGEIGLTSDEISQFEDQGFVMSGSRHRRMEAVRLRKENQIYSADERRALDSFNRIERDKRESRIIGQFKELVKTKKSDD